MQICDSIAIKVIAENKILRSIGNNLHFHTINFSRELDWRLQWKVHGIDYDKGSKRILIYGEKEFMILSYDDEEEEFHFVCRNQITDWISNGKLLKNDKFWLLTGHLVILELQHYENSCTILKKISCENKSTLYSSLVDGDIMDNLLIFGGTAWEVIIWQPKFNNIINRLSGNNGVILSIDINKKFNLLTITSDDRSIKFYKIFIRNDRFTPNKIKCEFDENFIKGYSHTARVFCGKLIEIEGHAYAVTAGEDSTICVWNCEGKLLFKRQNHHFGAIIWNFDYDSKTKTVWSSGSDGNCFQYCIPISSTENNNFPVVIKSNLSNESLEKIRFINMDFVIGITKQNDTVFRKLKSQASNWNKLNIFDKFKITVLEVYENSLIAISGYKKLVILKFHDVTENFEIIFNSEISTGIIRSIFYLSLTKFLACNEDGVVKILNLNNRETVNEFIMPKSKEPWITSCLLIENFLIICNRHGTLFLYLITNTENEVLLQSQLKCVNGNLGITVMQVVENFRNEIILKTYGHDNTIKIIKLNKIDNTLKIINRELTPIKWVANCFQKNNKQDYLIGFNSKKFLIWQKNLYLIFELDCGGGHRFWDFKIDFHNNKFQLIFLKSSKLNFIEQNLIIDKININLGSIFKFHLKSCNILISLKKFIISGGEDNVMKIWEFQGNSFLLKNEILTHISSIKTICCIQKISSSTEFLIFSAGGRAQICVTKLNIKNGHCEEYSDFMLKSTDFSKKYRKSNHNDCSNCVQDIVFDPETRIMSLDCIQQKHNNSENYIIVAGCSDGYIRKLHFRNNVFKFSNEEIFYNKCILQVRILFEKMVCTTSTNGTIEFWNLQTFNTNSTPFFQVKHHESGINCMDIKVNIPERTLYILTGGDDQHIVLSLVKYTDDGNHFQLELRRKEIFDNLHTAQVTGIKITKNFLYFYSTSVDQLICKVNMKTFKRSYVYHSNIADIKGLDLISSDDNQNENYCLVYGSGFESFSI